MSEGDISNNGVFRNYGSVDWRGSGTFALRKNDSGNQSFIASHGTDGDWYIRSSTNSGKVIIQDSGGNVGIGLSNPLVPLQVQGHEGVCLAELRHILKYIMGSKVMDRI